MSKGTWGIEEVIQVIGRDNNTTQRAGGNILYRGKWLYDPVYLEEQLKTGRDNGWVFYESWSNEPYVYAWVWDGDSRGAILTYCEGDLDLSVHPAHTPEYSNEYRHAELFYRRTHYEAAGVNVTEVIAAIGKEDR